ncbi:hypothetical protein PM082_020152 [Marasmius tenuissimus]|nr:hypothetical protein PM082_020152 [Marasmius tenuissimus]
MAIRPNSSVIPLRLPPFSPPLVLDYDVTTHPQVVLKLPVYTTPNKHVVRSEPVHRRPREPPFDVSNNNGKRPRSLSESGTWISVNSTNHGTPTEGKKKQKTTHERPTATRSIATTTRSTGLKLRRRKPLPDVPPSGTGTVPLSSHIVRPKKHGRSSARMTPSNYPPSPSPSHSSTSLEGNETSQSRPTIGQPIRIERLQLPGQAEGAVDLSFPQRWPVVLPANFSGLTTNSSTSRSEPPSKGKEQP